MMHGHEKSDSVIVAAKPANKVARPAVEQSAAEPVEPRAETKGNADQQSTCRAQSRISVSHTESCEGKEEGAVHRALPPHQHRPARRGVLRTQGGRSAGRGSTDVDGLRGRPRVRARGPA